MPIRWDVPDIMMIALSSHAAASMCFYDQRLFSCNHWRWTGFAYQCPYETRTGQTCGIRLINRTEFDRSECELCRKIDRKRRRLAAEYNRLRRWKAEGRPLAASIWRSQQTIEELEIELSHLQKKREGNRRTLRWTSGDFQFTSYNVSSNAAWRSRGVDINKIPEYIPISNNSSIPFKF